MKINSRNPFIHLRPLGILAACAVLFVGPSVAQTTISSAEVDLYHSAFVVDGTLDVDNPPAEAAFGVDMWSGSASSSGIGSYSSNGNYTSEVTVGFFSLSGTAGNTKTGASSGGNGTAAATLDIEFTVPVMSEGILSLPASISSANPGNNIYASLFLYEDGDAIISWQVFSSGSLSDTVTLNPGHNYRFVANLESNITESPATQSGSASSSGISMTVSAVPEPMSAALVVLGLGVLLGCRSRNTGDRREA